MKKDTNLIIRINSDLKDSVSKIAKENGYTLSQIVTASLKDINRRKKIPLFLLSQLPPKPVPKLITISEIKRNLNEIILKSGKGLIRKAYLFGSFARGEERADSDVDIRLEADRGLTLNDLEEIRTDLQSSLGKDIDLLCIKKDKMDPLFYESIRKDEICIYER